MSVETTRQPCFLEGKLSDDCQGVMDKHIYKWNSPWKGPKTGKMTAGLEMWGVRGSEGQRHTVWHWRACGPRKALR